MYKPKIVTRDDLAAHIAAFPHDDPEYGGDLVDWVYDWLINAKLTQTVLNDLVQDMWRRYLTQPDPIKRAQYAARYIATKELYVSLYDEEIDPDQIDVPDYAHPLSGR